ncbi:tail sheath protein [uncultured Caudovirales phage]|uniref:Tail sheath protein n=1 Tax=uncultured Caudovirales phage TaxID=2100421 RepID=A0A6J5M4Q7_9CAUD|nr:tail sheath protein [uncultured Caudovirales phage]
MGFQVSPGVVVTETDLTGIVPAVSTTDGGFVGTFRWGPLNDITLISDEAELVKRFGKPDANTSTSFFTAANFLAYGNKLRLVRVADESTVKNAVSSGTAVLIKNDSDYLAQYESGEGNVGEWAAKHPGTLGNSLKVSMCPSAEAFSTTLVGTYSSGSLPSTTLSPVIGGGTEAPENNVIVGSIITHEASGQQRKVVAIDPATDIITVNQAFDTEITAGTIKVRWEYADLFGVAPGTSNAVAAAGGSRDELHIVVVDEDGAFGTAGTILERYGFLSKASNAKSDDGSPLYYKTVINSSSQYIRWMDHTSVGTNWGSSTESVTQFTPTSGTAQQLPVTRSLTGGVDQNSLANAGVISARQFGYDLFSDSDRVDVSLILLGEASSTLVNYVISNVCEVRKDCVAFFSPERDDVVENSGDEVDDTIAFKNAVNISSSYAVMDSGWKLQSDKYNPGPGKWIPLNGDIAGLCVRTDTTTDPWYSPAGYNRGIIKNVTRLAYSPNKSERDDLYVNGINPVISTPGQGTLLFGDKTLLSKPSAFDRINVRRLFIVLEKAIARAAKFMLFEFNDEFTRQQFRNLVEPFLRDVQARRGIYDFKVVCDRTNNTSEVIDRNEFVGDIYIKPARAINFIQLNFIAVRTGVDFSEIVGRV